MRHVPTIVAKEWSELFRNKLVLATVGVLPLGFTALSVVVLVGSTALPPGVVGADDIPTPFRAECQALGDVGCGQLFLGRALTTLFFVTPLVLPTGVAAHSVVGEKVARTLEPLLATPVSTLELLVGKVLAAVIPACVATWLGFAVFAATGAAVLPANVADVLITGPWLAGVFGLAPLLSFLGVSVATIVSSRATDPRTAEQISGLLVMPGILLLVGQIAGLLVLTPAAVAIVAVGVVLLDVVMLGIAVQLFDRENILTRWR